MEEDSEDSEEDSTGTLWRAPLRNGRRTLRTFEVNSEEGAEGILRRVLRKTLRRTQRMILMKTLRRL